MKEIPISRVTYFQGYVVTANEDGSIPLNSIVIAHPLESFRAGPGLAPVASGELKEMDAVAVDRQWLVTFINGMLATEANSVAKLVAKDERIVELLENLVAVRGAYSDLKDKFVSDTQSEIESIADPEKSDG